MFRPAMLAAQRILNSGPVLPLLERRYLRGRPATDMPAPVFILGCPRSGTTLVYETLSAQYQVAYLTNLAMMFHTAPGLATALSFPRLGRPAPTFKSDIGFVPGLMAPSEAGRFWRQRAPENINTDLFDPTELRQLFMALSSTMCGSMLVKNLYLQSRLDLLFRAFPDMLVLHVTRDFRYTVQSILGARRKVENDPAHWWGPLPRAPRPSGLTPPEEVAWQVHTLDRELREDLAYLMDPARVLTLSYEAVCDDPRSALDEVETWYHTQTGTPLAQSGHYAVPQVFPSANRQSADGAQWQAIETALKEHSRHAL